MIASPDTADVARTVLSRAALVHRFDPLALMPPGLAPEILAGTLALIAEQASEVQWPDPDSGRSRTMWRLDPAARRRELAKLVAEGQLDAVLKQIKPARDDGFARYLREALQGRLDPADVPEPDRDSAAVAADFAAESLGTERGAAARGVAATLRTLLSDNIELQRTLALVGSGLIGRKDELDALERFVADGVVPEADLLPEPADPAIETRGYLLIGLPGAGKSALIAELVRRRRGYAILEGFVAKLMPAVAARLSPVMKFFSNMMPAVANIGPAAGNAVKALRSPVVLLDFDRPAIAVGGALEWSLEACRQLGVGRRSLADRLSSERVKVRQSLAQLDPTGSGTSTSATLSAISQAKEGIAAALGAEDVLGDTLVVIIDTFEEVIVRSSFDDRVENSLFCRLLSWADSLSVLQFQGKPVFRAVRVVVSGRESPPLDAAAVGRWFLGRRVIGDLDAASAATFLQRKDEGGRFKGARAEQAVQTIGGHPLTLILLALYARNQSLEEVDSTIREGDLGRVLGGEDAVRTLYSRFLDRIHFDTARADGVTREMMAVAQPGLALREITPELLRDVVCPACGLNEITPAQAQALFDRLRTQVWLVETIPGSSVIRHRSDIRRLMLPMMAGAAPANGERQRDLGERVLRVHKSAAAWYQRQIQSAGDAAQIEELYHRAFLPDHSLAEMMTAAGDSAPTLYRRLAESAGADVAAMPVEARAMLRFYGTGALRLTEDELAALPNDLRARATAERLQAARRLGTTVTAAEPAVPPPSATPENSTIAPASADGSGSAPPGGLVRGAPDQISERTASSRERTIDEVVTGEGWLKAAPPSPGRRRAPHEWFTRLIDSELSARIGYAFTTGDFETAARVGWEAVGEFGEFPDLSDPLRISEDPVMHWFWQTAMASLIARSCPAEVELHRMLERFAGALRRAETSDAAGFFFASGVVLTLGSKPALQPIEMHRADYWIDDFVVRSQANLREIALRSFWRPTARTNYLKARVPGRYIRLLSSPLGLSQNAEAIPGVVEAAAEHATSTAELESFLTSIQESLSFDNALEQSQQPKFVAAFLGLAPELYDTAVSALVAADREAARRIEEVVAAWSRKVVLWPADLDLTQVPARDRDRRAGVIAAVVRHVDRCGVLNDLLTEAASLVSDPHLVNVAALAGRYDEVLRVGLQRMFQQPA
uniref:Orc1-like AAA ATPase domain-containing protein n=1 Tax=Rhodopseudomonas palustris (strain BisA53) TaxID=316055 RepID=Q07HM4_RHOP5